MLCIYREIYLYLLINQIISSFLFAVKKIFNYFCLTHEDYTFPIDLTTNGTPLGAKSIGKTVIKV